jgi:FMN reductase
MAHPVVLAIGGSLRAGSTTERALVVSLRAAEGAGARVELMSGPELDLPLYDPKTSLRTPQAQRLVKLIAEADGLLIGTPAYHGTVSGLVKNALDHVEDLRTTKRPYFTGRAVGCLSVGRGWQGPVSSLNALRTITHALRGWPTPLGVAVNTELSPAASGGGFADPHVNGQLALVGRQVVEFARMSQALASATHAAGPRERAW